MHRLLCEFQACLSKGCHIFSFQTNFQSGFLFFCIKWHMKRVKCLIFCLFSIITYASAQFESIGLDALMGGSELIVQGKVLDKRCDVARNVNSIFLENCIISIEIHDTIKGKPTLSILNIQHHLDNDTSRNVLSIDTIKVLCFHQERYRSGSGSMASKNPKHQYFWDYQANIGDEILLFLNGKADTQYLRINIPKSWYVYNLSDRFLGIITANTHVSDYLTDKLKKK